jgi:protein-S-isoprenylcysteine O-methyltransferase Ste14
MSDPIPSARRRWQPWEGPRGEGWVILRAGLLAGYLVAPRSKRPWSTNVRRLAVALGVLLAGAGGVLAASGALALERQLTPLPHPRADSRLVERGPYRLVRHPIYSGVCLGAVGLALVTMSVSRLVLSVVIAIFLDAKASREEQWLSERFLSYQEYRQRVRKLIPGLYWIALTAGRRAG